MCDSQVLRPSCHSVLESFDGTKTVHDAVIKVGKTVISPQVRNEQIARTHFLFNLNFVQDASKVLLQISYKLQLTSTIFIIMVSFIFDEKV